MVNIRRQNQELASQSALYTASASRFIPRLTVQAILDSATSGQSALKSALQSILDSGDQLILKSTIQSLLDSTAQPQPIPNPAIQPDSRPIWPGRAELIYQRYLANKEAWLAANPEVQLTNYRIARKLKNHATWLNRRRKELPLWRLDLQTETLDKEDYAIWTDEEVEAWLDYEAELQKEADQGYEAVLVAAGGFGQDTTRGMRGIQSVLDADEQPDRDKYRFYGSAAGTA